MHCKACDAEMTDAEALAKRFDGEPEDLCGRCLGIVSSDLSDQEYPNDREEIDGDFVWLDSIDKRMENDNA